MSKRVVITGGSCVTPIGTEWSEIEPRLHSLKNGIVRMADWDKYENMNTRLAAPVDFHDPGYSRKQTRGMGRVGLMATTVADRAFGAAGLSGNPELKAGRCGVAFGSSTGSVDALLDFFSMLTTNSVQGITATTYIRSMPQTCAVNIGVFFGLTGRLITTNTACTAGSISIGYAYEAIKNGLQDMMVAGGAEELNPTEAAVFDTLYATSTKNDQPWLTPAAYDKDRDGLVIGEGAGALILEEYEHAKARGAKIYAELVGFGTNTDGSHITQPNRDTMGTAMRLALDSAGLSPDAIGYVNGHGTATQHGDIAETGATRDVFGRRVPISSLKSYMGHTLGACGAIEAWLSIQMMNAGWFSPNLNLVNIDPACGDLDYIQGTGRNLDAEYVMSNNFAFGGINTSLIFRKIG
ncbi:MAG TPA: beta-ketoacyl-ACP synthase [Treponemataceae bacterium]|nr:beta-ketoacyl-ACP synthase [Treponemataceae bacterium]